MAVTGTDELERHIAAVHRAYERLRVEILDRMPGRRVNVEDLTADQLRVVMELTEAERILADCRQRVHGLDRAAGMVPRQRP